MYDYRNAPPQPPAYPPPPARPVQRDNSTASAILTAVVLLVGLPIVVTLGVILALVFGDSPMQAALTALITVAVCGFLTPEIYKRFKRVL